MCSNGLRQYIVYFSSKLYPQMGTRQTIINAPSKKFIRDNWVAYCNGQPLKLVKIVG